MEVYSHSLRLLRCQMSVASLSFTVTSDHFYRREGLFSLFITTFYQKHCWGSFSWTFILLVISVLLFTLWSQAACNVLCLCKTAGERGAVLPPLAIFSTDFEVTAVYQVKTSERTQAGNLNNLFFKERRKIAI